MTQTKFKKLRIAILTGSGKKLVSPLIDVGINIVGISEMTSEFQNMGYINQLLEKLYWKFIKRSEPPYLSLYLQDKQIDYIKKEYSW